MSADNPIVCMRLYSLSGSSSFYAEVQQIPCWIRTRLLQSTGNISFSDRREHCFHTESKRPSLQNAGRGQVFYSGCGRFLKFDLNWKMVYALWLYTQLQPTLFKLWTEECLEPLSGFYYILWPHWGDFSSLPVWTGSARKSFQRRHRLQNTFLKVEWRRVRTSARSILLSVSCCPSDNCVPLNTCPVVTETGSEEKSP